MTVLLFAAFFLDQKGDRMFARLARNVKTSVTRFVRAEDGPTAVEYAVMLALIVVVCIAAITAIGAASNQTFSSVGSSLKPS